MIYDIFLRSLDNTTITVSYGTKTHILSTTNEMPILIPVMTENVCIVMLNQLFGLSLKKVKLQLDRITLTLDLYTKMYVVFYCTNMDDTTSRRIVHSVTLAAIGK